MYCAKIMPMLKKISILILVTVMTLALFAGCSSGDSGKSQTFEADKFVEECRILVPSSQYTEADLKNFEIDFSRAVLNQFAKSDYYKNMTDSEREAALNELGDILTAYSYGNAAGGFVNEFNVNMNDHVISWHIKDFSDINVMWRIPGY